MTDPSTRVQPASSSTAELRTDAERDLDRLLYTLYFRRLSGRTQVASLTATESVNYGLLHNRLTHSLKVGQVARRMAQTLLAKDIDGKTRIDPDVADFAGRAHDIGHPPYGHLGEAVLNSLADSRDLNDGFEGNAQSFRVLATLIRRRPVRSADKEQPVNLQLTSLSLASVVKYPYDRHTAPEEKKAAGKFGFIEPDRTTFETLFAGY